MNLKFYLTVLATCLIAFCVFANDDMPDRYAEKSSITNTELNPSFINWLNIGDELGNRNEIFRYDPINKKWTAQTIQIPLKDEIETFNKIAFDPVRFNIRSNKDSVKLNEEVELTISAEYLDIHPSLMFQFEGSNEFAIKMLLPEGFVQTGGTYYDFLNGKVTKENPFQTYTIKGYFEREIEEPCFTLLRSHKGANRGDSFVKKLNYCTFFTNNYSNELIRNGFRLQAATDIDFVSNSFIIKSTQLAVGCDTEFEVKFTNTSNTPHKIGFATCYTNCIKVTYRTAVIPANSSASNPFTVNFTEKIANGQGVMEIHLSEPNALGTGAAGSWCPGLKTSNRANLNGITLIDTQLSTNNITIIQDSNFSINVNNLPSTPLFEIIGVNPTPSISVVNSSTRKLTFSGASFPNVGIFNVTIKCIISANCIQTHNLTINVQLKPCVSPSKPTILVNGNPKTDNSQHDYKNGDQINLTANGCDLGTSLEWDTNILALNLSNSQTIKARCKVNDNNICISNWSIIKLCRKPNTPTITSVEDDDLPFYAGDTRHLRASGCEVGTLQWWVNNVQVTLPYEYYYQVNPTSTTIYKVKCVNNNSDLGISCESDWAEYTLTVCPTTTAPTISATNTTYNSGGQPITLSISASTPCSGILEWSDGSGATTLQVAPSVDTYYKVKCDDNDGCYKWSDPILIKVNTIGIAPAPEIEITTSSPSYVGNSISITATCPNMLVVSWEENSYNSTFIPKDPGTYTFKAKCTGNDPNGVPYTKFAYTTQSINIIDCNGMNPVINPNGNYSKSSNEGAVTINYVSGCDLINGTKIWSDGTTLNSITKNVGTYSINCKINDNCISPPATITIANCDKPDAPNINPSSYSFGLYEQKELEITNIPVGGSAKWYYANGQEKTDSYTNTSKISATNQAYYAVIIKDGCFSNQTNFNGTCRAPQKPVITSNSPSVPTGGASVILSSSCETGTPEWSTGANSLSITANVNNTYSVKCKNGTCETWSDGFSVNPCTPPNAPSIYAENGKTKVNIGQTASIWARGCFDSNGASGNVTWKNAAGNVFGGTPVDFPDNSYINVGAGKYSAKCTLNGCDSQYSYEIEITENSCSDFQIYASSNATNNPGSVGVGDLLTFTGGPYGGGKTQDQYNVLWVKLQDQNGTGVYQTFGDSYGFQIANAKISDGGIYKLRVQDKATNLWCDSAPLQVNISPCSYTMSGGYNFNSAASEVTVYAFSNKPCPNCIFDWKKPGDGSWQGYSNSLPYVIVSNALQNIGVYQVRMKNGDMGECIAEMSIDITGTPAAPQYQSFVGKLYCDNISGWAADRANPNVVMEAELVLYDNGSPLTPVKLTTSNNNGTWYYDTPFPDAFKDGKTYGAQIRHKNANIFSKPFDGMPKEITCCQIAFDELLSVAPICEPVTKTAKASFKFKNKSTGSGVMLHYRVVKQTLDETGNVNYLPVGSWINITDIANGTLITTASLANGEYKLEIKQSTLEHLELPNKGCLIFSPFTIDCSPIIGDCKLPVVTVSPADSVIEGVGIIPILTTKFLGSPEQGVNSFTENNFAKVASLSGNTSIGVGELGGYGTQGVSVEAWINVAENNDITIGKTGDGTKYAYLFKSREFDNNIKWALSVGSNGVTLYERSYSTGICTGSAERAALNYNGNMVGWKHIALVYANNLPILYINGAEVARATQKAKDFYCLTTAYDIANPENIGSNIGDGYKGLIDELKIWSKALTTTEIQVSIAARNTPAVTTPNLIGRFNFDSANKNQNIAGNGQANAGSTNLIVTQNLETSIYETSNFDWYYNGVLVATNAVKYTMPKELVRPGEYIYTIKYLGENNKQCSVQKTVIIKPAILAQLSGCYNISPMSNLSKNISMPVNPDGTGFTKITTVNPNIGENSIWKFESFGGNKYKIQLPVNERYLSSDRTNGYEAKLIKKINDDPKQLWSAIFIDSLSATPIINLKSADNLILHDPSIAPNYYLTTANPGNVNLANNNTKYKLTKTGCPIRIIDSTCIANAKIVFEKLQINNTNALTYLDNNFDEIANYIDKYRGGMQPVEFNGAGKSFGFYSASGGLPTNASGSTLDADTRPSAARVSGYYCPQTTGNYNFELTGSRSRLYISSNEDARNKQLIIDHKSGAVNGSYSMTKGRSYYFEILLLDMGGTNFEWLKLTQPGNVNGMNLNYFSSIPRDKKLARERNALICGQEFAGFPVSDFIPNLFPGDTIHATDFQVIVEKVVGSNGTFSGEGHSKVKYLYDTQVKVKFEGVTVNDYYDLVGGEITTDYDSRWGNIASVDSLAKVLAQEVSNVAEGVKNLKDFFNKGDLSKYKAEDIQNFADGFLPELEKEYNKALADQYASVLNCAKTEIAIIEAKQSGCDAIPKVQADCDAITAAKTRLTACKNQFDALEVQRANILENALKIIKESLVKIIGTDRDLTNNTLDAKRLIATNSGTLPNTAQNNKGDLNPIKSEKHQLSDLSAIRRAKVLGYFDAEVEYNKSYVGKFFSLLNQGSNDEAKRLAEVIIAKDGNKLSKMILDRIAAIPAVSTMGSTERETLKDDIAKLLYEQLFEAYLGTDVYNK